MFCFNVKISCYLSIINSNNKNMKNKINIIILTAVVGLISMLGAYAQDQKDKIKITFSNELNLKNVLKVSWDANTTKGRIGGFVNINPEDKEKTIEIPSDSKDVKIKLFQSK